MPPNVSLYLFRSLALTIVMITLVQSFEPPSNKNISNSICINGHITNKLAPAFHINYLSMEPVLFEKLYYIKLSRSVLELSSFSNLTRSSLNTLLEYAKDLDDNIKTFTQN